ncbi:hypothetical protein [Halalkalibacter akibai]|uniref:hypothetical protein n=1 Tax=Halalkalibacter akibai TaxID=1411 RepID=UPI0005535F27|nr:hypothetical protein [Halalkalibacter akibai]
MKRRFGRFHNPYHNRPSIWLRIKLVFGQILLPLICFQLLRTLLLPTTFDVILLTIMIVFYCSIRFQLI